MPDLYFWVSRKMLWGGFKYRGSEYSACIPEDESSDALLNKLSEIWQTVWGL